MPVHKLIQIVAAESTPEKDIIFEKWYREVHVPLLFGYKGVKQASRYRLKGNDIQCARYLTIYEFDSEEELRAFPESPAFKAAIDDFEKHKEAVGFTQRWVGVYELIKAWVR